MGLRFTGMCWCLFAALALALPAEAREVASRAELRTPYDWTEADRLDWSARSARDTREEIAADLAAAKASNTFVRSALANTERQRAAEYRTAAERHAYYDLMAQVLEGNDNTALRGIRYFHSAAAVSGHEEETTRAESLPGRLLGPEARKLLEDIHRKLFRANVRVLHGLLFDWKAPRLPEPETAEDALPVTPIVFDVAMVDFEQAVVERALAARGYPAKEIARINFHFGLSPSVWARRFSPLEVARRWTVHAGWSKEDFASRGWRVAMGRALVLFFHGYREREARHDPLLQSASVRSGKLRM